MDFSERLQLYLEGGMITEKDVENVNKVISLFEKEYGVTLQEENADTFIAHLCAAYARLHSEEDIDELPEEVLNELTSLDTYPLSTEVLDKVMKATDIPLNETEQGYLLLHINNLISFFQTNDEWN